MASQYLCFHDPRIVQNTNLPIKNWTCNLGNTSQKQFKDFDPHLMFFKIYLSGCEIVVIWLVHWPAKWGDLTQEKTKYILQIFKKEK